MDHCNSRSLKIKRSKGVGDIDEEDEEDGER